MSILSPSYHLVFFAQTGSYFSKQMEECSFTEKLPSIFFINNSTMPDWLWFLSSSIYKIVLIYTFLFFLPALFSNKHPSQILYADPVTNAEFLLPCCLSVQLY